MSKLIMMKGLPASGKTTKAKEIVEQGNWVRLNKDLIRTMLHFDKWTGINESITQSVAIEMAYFLLESGINVVIDDTNLGQSHLDTWKGVVRSTESKFEVVDMTDIDISDCIRRDFSREKSVGVNVIMSMAMQYGLYKPHKGYVICDIDGTIANIKHRLHYVKGVEKKDWKGFFSEIHNDTLNSDVDEQLKALAEEGYDIVFVSARPEDYRKQTAKWLLENVSVSITNLIMRGSGDRRDDVDVKRDILNKYFKNAYIHKVFDDRPKVIKMWQEKGLDVVDCGEGIEF